MRDPADLLKPAADPPDLAADAGPDDAALPPGSDVEVPLPAPIDTGRRYDLQTYLAAVAADPYRYDFYQVMRRIEALTPQQPRLGCGFKPADEAIRLAQQVSMSFAPAPIGALLPAKRGGAPRLEQRFFGMLGPNGPLPLHLTDFTRERLLHAGDETLARFLDVLTHRFLLLFFRAWSQGRPTSSLDRPQQDRFATYVGALVGVAEPAARARDAVEDHAKLYYAGLLNAQTKREDGLVALLAGYFRLPVAIESFVGHWMPLPPQDRTRLQPKPVALRGAMAGNRLGHGAILGPRVWDRQHKIRVRLGPLSWQQFEMFLPGGMALPKLVALLRLYLNRELEWDAQLLLRADQVPKIGLGRAGRLGYSTWLGAWRRPLPACDLVLDAEALAR